MYYSLSAALIVGSIQSAMQLPTFPGKILIWLLFVLSIVSWVMIVSKAIQLNRMKKADRKFSTRLRQSRTTLEVFEEGWRDENSLQLQIYHAGARETAFQLLGSRNPTVGVTRQIASAGVMSSKQHGFLESAFRAGYRSAVARLTSGVNGLRLIGASAILIGLIGAVWTLMVGFDQAEGGTGIPAATVGSALGFVVIALLVATPAFLSRIAFSITVEKRRHDIRKFRDDIARLFERKFATLNAKTASSKPLQEEEAFDPLVADEPSGDDFDPDDSDSGGGKKRYHSIRDRLLNPDADQESDNELSMNPIARQAATLKPRT